MPLIGKIQIAIGIAFILVCIIMRFKSRPKTKKKGLLLINNVHIIDGNGTESFQQNVLIKDGRFAKITSEPITTKNVETIDGTNLTLMPGLIDSHVHIQGLNNRSDEESDAFLESTIPSIFTILQCALPSAVILASQMQKSKKALQALTTVPTTGM